MSVQHKTLRDEVLFVLGRATAPLNSSEIYERCTLADEMKQVSNVIFQLKDLGKIAAAEGDGRKRYTLAHGVAAPAPAGKTGRSKAVQSDEAARSKRSFITLAGEKTLDATDTLNPAGPPVLDIPTLGDHGASLGGAAGKTVQREPEAPSAPVDDEVAKGLDLVERQLENERLADAIIARLKRQLAPTMCELEAAAGLDRLNVHIHIDQVDFHLGGL